MNLKGVSLLDLRGTSTFFSGPMNVGKTADVVHHLRSARYFGLSSIGYNSSLNTREENSLVVNCTDPHFGKTVASIAELKDDFQMRRSRLTALGHSPQQLGEPVEIEGVEHYMGYPLDVIGLDEANLFCLNYEGAQETLDFIGWCNDNSVALFMSGLLYDFRHMKFGHFHSLLPYIDFKQEKKGACMAVLDEYGTSCPNTALHTQRVLLKEHALNQGLEDVLGSQEPFYFIDKERPGVQTEYIAAPFFDKTLRIDESEEDGSKTMKYLPVCTPCARLPYKEEVFEIYDTIVRGDATFGFLGQLKLTNVILTFLRDENWVQQDSSSGVLVPTPFYRNRVSGFTPHVPFTP